MWVDTEIERIEHFIQNYVEADETVVILVSGGLDSDVTARLCSRALGKDRIKLCIVLQTEFEEKFYYQAAALARDLGVDLAEIHLENVNRTLIAALEGAEETGIFQLNTLLDPAKAKCSLRSAVISCYQDKGYLIAGTTNKTEKLLGFFLTFGDNLAHFKPIAHLYRTQVEKLAIQLGTAPEVIAQKGSAGLWKGQTDAEDLAYWIINDGPILAPRSFTEAEEKRAAQMAPELTPEHIDDILWQFEHGKSVDEAEQKLSLDRDIIRGIFSIAGKAPKYKTRKILQELGEVQ